jgi:hypothetical protein
MQLTATTRVSFPRELVFKTYRDDIDQTVPYLPNVKSIEVKERQDDGPRTSLLNVWTAKTELPALARKFVKADMLSWTDRARWDQSAWQCEWQIETHAFPGLMECRGHTEFLEAGGETEIRISGDLSLHLERAHIPRFLAHTVQPVIEKIIIHSLKPNLLSTGEGVARLLASKEKR